MPSGGHNRKTDKEHLLSGTFRADRHGNPDDKVEFADGGMEPPKELKDLEREEWFRICPILKSAGLLKPAYRATITRYCVLSALAREMGGAFPLDKELRQYINMLGLCPQAASRIGGVRREKPGAGKFEDV